MLSWHKYMKRVIGQTLERGMGIENLIYLWGEKEDMNEASYEAAEALVPKTYVSQGRDARKTHEKQIRTLIEQVRLRGGSNFVG